MNRLSAFLNISVSELGLASRMIICHILAVVVVVLIIIII